MFLCSTAFGVIANRWDFYKSEAEKIGDRVQYRKKECKGYPDTWKVFHVAA